MASPMNRVRPRELKGILLNPHKGCATFQRFNGDPLYEGRRWSEFGPTEFPPRKYDDVTPGYLPCTVAYCRWFWPLFEPEDGRFDWSVIELALAVAAERRQTLQVRLMPHGSANQVPVPQWYRDKYTTIERVTHGKGQPCNCPVYDSPEFIDRWGRVVGEFGRRFDGHPWLESVDVSFIGPWGEGAGECSDDAIDAITQTYVDAHPKTPLMTMISGHKMTAGVRAGMGWRLDCFGDIGTFENPNLPREKWWMHHFDCYPKEVCVCGAQDAWKNGPVTFESCGVPADWFRKGFDLDFILQQGYKLHGTVLMPKSTAIPDEYLAPLGEFCDRIGYKFVLRQFLYESRVKSGDAMHFECWVENVGVAPIYHPYDFVLRFAQGKRTFVHRSPANVRTWLPGDAWLIEDVTLPGDFEPGNAVISAALVRADDHARKVRFANEDVDDDGWLTLDAVEIT